MTNEQLTFVRSKIESEWQERILPIQRLAERWAANRHRSETDMKSDASLLMGAYPDYQAMEWLDPSFHAQWIAPRVENDSAPRGIPSDAEQLAALAGTGSGISARLVNLSGWRESSACARAGLFQIEAARIFGCGIPAIRIYSRRFCKMERNPTGWLCSMATKRSIQLCADSAEKDADWAQRARHFICSN